MERVDVPFNIDHLASTVQPLLKEYMENGDLEEVTVSLFFGLELEFAADFAFKSL